MLMQVYVLAVDVHLLPESADAGLPAPTRTPNVRIPTTKVVTNRRILFTSRTAFLSDDASGIPAPHCCMGESNRLRSVALSTTLANYSTCRAAPLFQVSYSSYPI